MSTTTPNHELHARLRAAEVEVKDLRDLKAQAKRTADVSREKFAASGANLDSPLYADAQAARDELTSVEDRLEYATTGHHAILKQLGQPAGTTRPGDTREVARLTAQPGAWLAAVLDRRKAQVNGLPDELRMKALTTGANISTSEESAALIDLLSPLTVYTAAGVPTITTDATELRIPRFTELPEAAWVAELGQFPLDDPGVEMVEARPPKAGLVTTLSIEAFADMTPAVLAMLQTQLLRAVALRLDHGIFFGTGTGPQPRGLANTVGIGTETGASLDDLSGFAAAIATLLGENAQASALILNPQDVGQLIGVTEGETSRVPLWDGPVAGTLGLRLPRLGVPLYPTPACPKGTGLLFDPATLAVVVRTPADIAIDQFFSLDTGVVGIRVYCRAMPVVGNPAGTVKITFAAPAP